MLVVLGWATVVAIVLTTVATVYMLWLALYRPWFFRPRLRVPREADALPYVVVDQDNPFPWI